jgi:hypothetical protein
MALERTLFQEDRPEIKISITIRIRENGALEVAGLDYGKLVLELQGKSDYEYYLLMDREQKLILKQKLRTDNPGIHTDADLLRWFHRHYNRNEAFSEIVNLLKRLEIKHEVSTW